MGRLGRLFDGTTCDGINVVPDAIGTELRRYEKIGPFCNTGNSTACVSVNFDSGTCVDANNINFDLVIPAAYKEFNPANISESFLGSIGNESPGFFQFQVEANSTFVIVGTQVRGINATEGDGLGCTFGVVVGLDDECSAFDDTA